MTISLNGETVDTREAKTIAELIDRYKLAPQSILVEHNGLVVHRHEERNLFKHAWIGWHSVVLLWNDDR